eukprot:4389686-Karenia_brevis.AAC.1
MSSDEKCGGVPSTTYVAFGTMWAFSSKNVAMDLGIAILACFKSSDLTRMPIGGHIMFTNGDANMSGDMWEDVPGLLNGGTI